MSSEKHEMICYNNDCYICVYTRQEEEKCCCLSLHELTRDCKNDIKGKLFPVFILDAEYLNMFINFSIPHPDFIVGFLRSDDKFSIRLIEVKRILPKGKEEFKIEQIRKAIDEQLVRFFNSKVQPILTRFNIGNKIDIKFLLVVPKNVYNDVNDIIDPHKLPKLIKKYKLNELKDPALKAIATGLVKPFYCEALDPSCNTSGD